MTTWWNQFAEVRLEDFKIWTGDFNQPGKVYFRNHVATKNYQSLIDCGCGVAADYYAFKQDGYTIEYTGLDSCNFFIKLNRENGIQMVEAELEKTLPITDNSYDLVYCREVIEHLSFYEKTISEFIRIGKKEVLILWFIKPDNAGEQINYWAAEDLYHNKYNLNKLENFILDNSKVKNLEWININEKQDALHIYLKEE